MYGCTIVIRTGYSEGINLTVLREQHESTAAATADWLVEALVARRQCRHGHFRARHTIFGWNAAPSHSWVQSQTMRALGCYAERR